VRAASRADHRAEATVSRDDVSKPPAAFALLTLLTLGVWGWSAGNGFVFDDLANILSNPWIKDWALLPQAFRHHAAGFDPGYSTSFYRPMMHVLYAIVYAVAGARPWAYHVLNVALHLLTVLGVYVLARAVLVRWSDPERYAFLPLVAAIVFSVHPVHTEPVLWVAGITDLSYAAFGVLALVAYMRAFRAARFALAAGALLLVSLLCKETGAVMLPLMILFEWNEARAVRAWTPRAAFLRLAPALAAVAVYLGLRLAALGSFAPGAAQHPQGALELAAAAAGLFARYLGVLVAPLRLSVMRSIHLDGGFTDPLAAAGLIAAAALAVAAYRLRRSAIAVLCLAFAALPILPVLYVPAIESGHSLFGERYLYLPVLGIGLATGWALEAMRRRFAWGFAAAVATMTIVVGWGATAAAVRTGTWSTSLSLWTDAALKAPDSAAAQEGLCFALYTAQRIPEAVDACARALAIDPARADARVNYATALLALGRAREAKTEFDVALSRRPASAPALVNRGLACMMLGQPDEAMSSYRRALEIDPNYAEAYNVIGVALARAGRREEALAHFERAVRLAPDNGEYRGNLRAVMGGPPRF
jgi:protein O-mannosyl-transferase